MNKFTIVKTLQQTWAVVDADGVVINELVTRAKARDLARELTESTNIVEQAVVEETKVEEIVTEEVVEEVKEEVKEEVIETVVLVESVKKVRKSDQVRARIAIAKQNSEADAVVVQWAIDNLGMARQLARVYVKNNWAKV